MCRLSPPRRQSFNAIDEISQRITSAPDMSRQANTEISRAGDAVTELEAGARQIGEVEERSATLRNRPTCLRSSTSKPRAGEAGGLPWLPQR